MTAASGVLKYGGLWGAHAMAYIKYAYGRHVGSGDSINIAHVDTVNYWSNRNRIDDDVFATGQPADVAVRVDQSASVRGPSISKNGL